MGLMLKDVRIAAAICRAASSTSTAAVSGTTSIPNPSPSFAEAGQLALMGPGSAYFNHTESILSEGVEQEGFDADYTAVVKVLEKKSGITLC